MLFSADVVNLLLYCAQQLGVTLGVGAQTIMLIAYLMAMRDGMIDDQEAQFVRAVRSTLNIGLTLIILSGIGITAVHLMADQPATIFSEAYLFKWGLIITVLIFTLLKNFPQKILLGLAGGSWYALFVVHILAPVASWINLLTLYVVWMIGFCICWGVLVIATRTKKSVKEKIIAQPVQKIVQVPVIKQVAPIVPKVIPTPLPPAPKPIIIPPAPPKPPSPVIPKLIVPVVIPPKPVAPPPTPPANLPVLEQKHILQTLPQPEAQKAPAAMEKKEESPWLPSIQIMPKTQTDADKHPVNIRAQQK